MINTLRACQYRFSKEFLSHWKLSTPNVHLHAGAAYAKGLEVARRGYYESSLPADESMALGGAALIAAYGSFTPPEGTAKTVDRMLGALEFYSTAYPFASDAATPSLLPSGRRGIEFSFSSPLPIKHPETNEPLIYCGRSDMVADYAGERYILDDKTASQLGASWAGQWDLRSQFTGYAWLAAEMGVPVRGVIVRGISILKTKYDTLQAITHRPQWVIDRWLGQVVRDLTRAKTAWLTGYWDYNLDESCNAYGGCSFKRICTSEDQTPWLNMYFERRVWNPLTRTETLIPGEGNAQVQALPPSNLSGPADSRVHNLPSSGPVDPRNVFTSG